jgi:hypothetical protein
MTLFTFTYKHPVTKQFCTVDSGKLTQMEAFIDIVRYMRRTGLRKLAPKCSLQIKDESLRAVRSSHGELTIDARGNVTFRRLDNPDPDGGGHLARIHRFDLGEWLRYWHRPLPAAFDILDLGYWYSDDSGRDSYAPPDTDWRTSFISVLEE